jgi:hypothetical protein
LNNQRLRSLIFSFFKKLPIMEHEKDKVVGENDNQPVQDNAVETEVAENQPEQVSAASATGCRKTDSRSARSQR